MPDRFEDDEVTLKEIIISFRKGLSEIWRGKYWVIAFCIPFLIYYYYQYKTTPIRYPAEVTFMIDDGQGGGMSLGGLLGSLGGNSSSENYDKIVALSKSMRIVQEVMLTKAVVGGQLDFLGNHLIRIEQVNERFWKDYKSVDGLPTLNGFLFTKDTFQNFSRLEFSAMKFLRDVLNGSPKIDGIFSIYFDEESGIIHYNVKCRQEEMSIVLLNTYFNVLSRFYIEKKIEKNIATYNIIKSKADSIKRALNSLEVRQATFDDASHSILLNLDKVPSQRFDRDKQLLSILYGESTKNLEMADYALKSSAPYIQLIDGATPPLPVLRPSLLKLLVTGLSIGMFLGISFVFIRKAWKQSKAV